MVLWKLATNDAEISLMITNTELFPISERHILDVNPGPMLFNKFSFGGGLFAVCGGGLTLLLIRVLLFRIVIVRNNCIYVHN